MIEAAIGAAGSMLSSVIGGAMGMKNAQKALEYRDRLNQSNENFANHYLYQQADQTAEALRLDNKSVENAREGVVAARGAQAVGNGTEEGVATAMREGNRLISDTRGNMNLGDTANKMAILSDYRQTKNSLGQQYIDMYNQRAANMGLAASSASQGFTNLASTDISSHLNTGKNLFGAQFRGSVAPTASSFGSSTSNTIPGVQPWMQQYRLIK